MLFALPLWSMNGWRYRAQRWIAALTSTDPKLLESSPSTNGNTGGNRSDSDNDDNDADDDSQCCICSIRRCGASDIRLHCRHLACHWCAMTARHNATRCVKCQALVDFDDNQQQQQQQQI